MLKAGLKPLEPYKGFHAKWKCLHIECGKIVYPTYASIQGGQGGCRDCGFKKGSSKRKNDDASVMEVMKKAKLKPMEPYENTNAKWKCRCLVCNKSVVVKFKHVRRNNRGCQYCSKRLVDEKDAVKVMLKAKLKPLVPYKNNKGNWKCKCLVCNKIVYPTYNSVQKQGGCKYCAGNFKDPAKAEKIFIKANLKPLEPYKSANAKWKSRCLTCNEIVFPTFANVNNGHSGCIYCSDIGFKPQEPAILYLITHHRMNAIKIGITNANTIISRLNQFKRQGWTIHKKYSFKKGIRAALIEDDIMAWLKKDLKLTNHLTPKDMPITGGHTETFNADSITVVEIQKRVEKLIKGYRKIP